MAELVASEARRCGGELSSSGQPCGARVLRCTRCGRTGCNQLERSVCSAQAFVKLECRGCHALGEVVVVSATESAQAEPLPPCVHCTADGVAMARTRAASAARYECALKLHVFALRLRLNSEHAAMGAAGGASSVACPFGARDSAAWGRCSAYVPATVE